jgi:hypothetical protein
MAFDQLEPFGESRIDARVKVAIAWLVSHLREKPIDPDDIKGISPEISEPLDDVDEPLDYSGPEVSDDPVGPSSAAILRDLAEQNIFR